MFLEISSAQLQEAERNALANPQQKLEAQPPTKAAGEVSFDRGVFQYVVSRCQCGHGWDTHDQSDPDPSRMPCRMRDCECQKFVDTDELIIPPLPPVRLQQSRTPLTRSVIPPCHWSIDPHRNKPRLHIKPNLAHSSS